MLYDNPAYDISCLVMSDIECCVAAISQNDVPLGCATLSLSSGNVPNPGESSFTWLLIQNGWFLAQVSNFLSWFLE